LAGSDRQSPHVRLLDNASVTDKFNRMTERFTEVADKALRLPQNEQLRLARTLLENTEATGDVGAEAAWEEEIERRIRNIDSGLAKGRPFGEVLRDIDRRLKK